MQPILMIVFLLSLCAMLMLVAAVKKVSAGSSGGTPNFLDPVNEMWRRRVDFRCESMSEVGAPWDDVSLKLVSNTSVARLATKVPAGVRLIGMMEIDVDGQKVQLFDMLAALSGKYNPYRNGFQTLFTTKLTEKIDLPHFYVYPGGPLYRPTMTAYDEVELRLMSMGNCVLESTEPFRARSVFDSGYAYDELLPFIQRQDWAVEWNGTQLLAYSWNKLIEPHEMKARTAEFLRLADMLQPAAEAFRQFQDKEIEILAAKVGAEPAMH